MIGLHVRHDRHLGVVDDEGAVTLVGLDDEDVVAAVVGVRAVLGELATDGEGRVEAAPLQRDGQQRGRRRLAVGAGDGDRPPVAHERGQPLGPVQHGDAALAGGDELDVVVADRGAHDDRVGALLVGLVEAHPDRCPFGLERPQHGHVLGVAAGHGDAARQHDACDARHAGPPMARKWTRPSPAASGTGAVKSKRAAAKGCSTRRVPRS